MKTIHASVLLLALFGFGFALSSTAAPSLPISKPPVTPTPGLTGPDNDPHAVAGQWFLDLPGSNAVYRTHQFHDNTPDSGGGSKGSLAIQGRVKSVEYFGLFNPEIVAFNVEAIVANDTPALSSWTNGVNSQGEQLTTTDSFSNTLRNVILTVNFATAGPLTNEFNPPYPTPYIAATNHDVIAWYGWNSATNREPRGDFFVPGWKLGDLEPGQSVTQLLHFVVVNSNGWSTSIANTDPRYDVISNATNTDSDIFIARSLSLKIATWIHTPNNDNASPYPLHSESGTDLGNASVFHDIIATPPDSPIAIASILLNANESSVYLNSTGATGTYQQILQYTTDLTSTNWTGIVTNFLPSHYTNHWTNSPVTDSIGFYRIVQP